MTNLVSLAGCIIQDKQERTLLIHRNTPNRSQWELPGGKIEPGEFPEDAAIRELCEELGIEVEIVKKVGEKQFIEDGYEMNYHWFLATIKSGEPTLKELKFDQLNYFSWFGIKQIESQLSANTQNLLSEYLNHNIKL